MMRFFMPVILIGISITVFFTFTDPLYNSTDPLSPGIVALKAQVASYNNALGNSKTFESKRDLLTQKESAMKPADLVNLQKLLPDNIENIRLILEITNIAKPYNMVLKDIKYSASDATANPTSTGVAAIKGGGVAQNQTKDYGIWDLSFSTIGTYNNFINFTKDLQKNLRIVDISSIQFASNTGSVLNSSSPDSYTYNFNIKTYWLKN